MSARHTLDTRLEELLAGEAAGDLDAAERRELDHLLAQDEVPARDDFLRLAGLLQASFLKRDRRALEAMPATLRECLLKRGRERLRRVR